MGGVRLRFEIKSSVGSRKTIQKLLQEAYSDQQAQIVYLDYGTALDGSTATELPMTFEQVVRAANGQWQQMRGRHGRHGVLVMYPGQDPVLLK